MANPAPQDNNQPQPLRKSLDITKLRKTSIREIAKDPKKVEGKDEPKKEEKVEDKSIEPIKPLKEEPKIDPEKLATEAAEKAAKKATESLQKELEELKKSNLTASEKKEEKKKLVSKWSEEKRTPKDYDEIYNEASEAGFKKAQEYFENRLKEIETENKKKQDEYNSKLEQDKETVRLQNEAATKYIENDLEELIQNNHLKREDEETRKALFDQAIAYNNKRIAEGKPAEPSIAKFYFMHFKKPNQQPAGGDAPVSGAKATPKENKTDRIPYNILHNSSYRQLINRVMSRGK